MVLYFPLWSKYWHLPHRLDNLDAKFCSVLFLTFFSYTGVFYLGWGLICFIESLMCKTYMLKTTCEGHLDQPPSLSRSKLDQVA